jgi:hypothetical protein
LTDWLIIEKFEFSDTLFFKNEVNRIIVEKKIENNIQGKSTTGINCEQYDLFQYSNDIQIVIDKIKYKIETSLKENNFISQNLSLQIKSAWVVLGFENCFHTIHKHNSKCYSNHISTVTYLNLPENDKNRSGNFYAILRDNENENNDYHHSPELGEIIMFPVWVYHGTYPQGKGLRQTLNMDFEVVYI